ncbi:hypothetical protein BY458DRAFT_536569 [Sporodiniella umbellata]|nr:hypothetical protein BY458DRAFT_536569 [Sporodiniella umbellata]
MVEDASTNDLIRWAPDGLSFLVLRHEEFAKKVLPRFFKHSNFSSFVRQLNMYGFHKVPHLQNGVLSTEGELERWEFSNPHFQKSHPDLLLLVTRKKGRDPEEKEAGATDINHILDEISAIKKHQMSISNELKNVQNDNMTLWQENIASKERHIRHQETIDRILQFLASVFSGDKSKHGVTPRKRQYLLEAATAEGSTKKQKCKIESVEDEDDSSVNNPSPAFSSSEEGENIPKLTKNVNIPLASDVKYAASELADAIELNNQTKKATAESLNSIPLNLHKSKQPAHSSLNGTTVSSALTTTQNPIDFSALFNLPQFQSLLGLASSNPTLFNQLTGASYFNTPQEVNNKTQPTTSALSPIVETPTSSLAGESASAGNTPTHLAEDSAESNELDNNFKSFVSELGLEAEKFGLEGSHSMDFINIDDFLNTYSQPSSFNVNNKNEEKK